MTSMTGATGFGRKTSTGTLKRGGMQGEYIPKGMRAGQLQNFTPEAMDLYKQLFSHVGPDSYLSRLAGGDEALFNEIEAPALRQFSALQGNMASRFSRGGGEGSLSARHSSGFQNAMTAAGSNFAQDLQAQRQGLQRQALGDLFSMSEMLMGQRPYERQLYNKQQKQSSGWGGLIGAGVGGVGGFMLGGPMGAMQGAQLGYGVGSAF